MTASPILLSPSLEDYLETILELIRDREVARVRDIARIRDVKPGSVSPALKRLEELGLVRYERREFIRLTPAGEEAARRVVARHRILVEFFTRVLKMPAEDADRDACAMEHHLSDTAMDRLVRLFEFMQSCPGELPTFLQEFHLQLDGSRREPRSECVTCGEEGRCGQMPEGLVALAALEPGETGRVWQVKAKGAVRQRLLDMGLLPGATISVERRAPSGDPVWIRLHGYQLSIRRTEAGSIHVVRDGQ
jgi:DtxR family transcriptional regulator, Mn-dependent transcriptional regulator